MSKARDKYYLTKVDCEFDGNNLSTDITDYVTELEQQKAELLNMLKKVGQHNADILLPVSDWSDLYELLNKYKEN